MATLTQEMKDLIAAQQCYVATVNPDGTPNVGPKRSTRVLDDEHIVYNEVTARQTWTNIRYNPRVAIAVVDREKMKGFRFVGTAEPITSGALFDETVEAMRARGMMAPLTAVVKVTVDRIYNLGIPGAGDQLA
ncbi:MAG TPA: pyridoxamine 5'-phosphate oxidase family protein [Chloroflexota bacterium]